MGFNQLYYSELLAVRNEILPATRDFKTICLGLNDTVGSIVTDSAAAATAIFRGKKTKIGYLGLNAEQEELASIGRYFKEMGWSVAVITNTMYSDATPAGVYATSPSREDIGEITRDLCNNDFIDVLVAGGLEKLDVNPFTGKPKNDSPLFNLAQAGYDVLGVNFKRLLNAEGEKRGTMAFVTMGDMSFEDKKMKGEHTFSEVVKTAFSLLDKDEHIFAMIECGRVDDACHINSDESVTAELIEFQKILGNLLNRFSEEDTLFIVLSDHETGGFFLYNGYPDGTNLSFNWGIGDHTGSYVPILVKGKGSENFHGFFHLEEIFPKIKNLFSHEQGE